MHRFRSTFGVELLLLAGVPLERVSIRWPSKCEGNGAALQPWVRARQAQLDADVRRTWNADAEAEIGPKYEVVGGGGRSRITSLS